MRSWGMAQEVVIITILILDPRSSLTKAGIKIHHLCFFSGLVDGGLVSLQTPFVLSLRCNFDLEFQKVNLKRLSRDLRLQFQSRTPLPQLGLRSLLLLFHFSKTD